MILQDFNLTEYWNQSSGVRDFLLLWSSPVTSSCLSLAAILQWDHREWLRFRISGRERSLRQFQARQCMVTVSFQSWPPWSRCPEPWFSLLLGTSQRCRDRRERMLRRIRACPGKRGEWPGSRGERRSLAPDQPQYRQHQTLRRRFKKVFKMSFLGKHNEINFFG